MRSDLVEQRVDRRERHGEHDDLASINGFRVSGDLDRLARRVPASHGLSCMIRIARPDKHAYAGGREALRKTTALMSRAAEDRDRSHGV